MNSTVSQNYVMNKKAPKDDERPREKRKRLLGIIQANSLLEVKEGVEAATPRLRRHLTIKGERFQQGHVIEALLAFCLTRPHEEQLAMAREGQAIIEDLRKLDGPGPALDGPDSTISWVAGVAQPGAGRKAPVPSKASATNRVLKERRENPLAKP